MTDSVPFTLSEMFFDLNKSLCDAFSGLDPIKLLDYPAEDVFDLINGLVGYGERKAKTEKIVNGKKIIRRKAGDDWF